MIGEKQMMHQGLVDNVAILWNTSTGAMVLIKTKGSKSDLFLKSMYYLGLLLLGKQIFWELVCWGISGKLMILRNIQSSVGNRTHRIKIKTTTSDMSTYFWSFSYSRSKSLSTCGEMEETCREIWEERIESLFKEVCGQTALVFYKLSWVCNHKNRIYRAAEPKSESRNLKPVEEKKRAGYQFGTF